MVVRDVHDWNITRSALLARNEMSDPIHYLDVVRTLNRAKIPFVLVGAYGLAGWRKEARSTEDVDVVVAARQVKKAVEVLQAAYRHLEVVDLPVVARMKDPENQIVAIDVMKPIEQPYREVFKHTQKVVSGNQSYRVPCLEMALTMKFSAMTSRYRADKDKFQDAHDFILMVENNPDVDKDRLKKLASLIYPDGGKDALELVRKVQAGEKLVL